MTDQRAQTASEEPDALVATPANPSAEPQLVVDVEGFEGPLGLLLHLARQQKVDLSRVSILALARQYLDFIDDARDAPLELAADYLVMAAWLAYLKARLLLPQQADEDDGNGEEMAELLRFRLERLEAIRQAARQLSQRPRLHHAVFARGAPEATITRTFNRYSASLHALLTAYVAERQRTAVNEVRIAERSVLSLSRARELLIRHVGRVDHWTALQAFLCPYVTCEAERRTALASGFAASLELVREGRLEIRQAKPFAPIYMRERDACLQSPA